MFNPSLEKLKNLLLRPFLPFRRKNSQYRIQTFTYYIPAPPPRKTGYREKEFDKLFFHFINQGYEILSINTESHSGPQSSGMWVVATLRATTEKAAPLNLDFAPTLIPPEASPFERDTHSEGAGIYYGP